MRQRLFQVFLEQPKLLVSCRGFGQTPIAFASAVVKKTNWKKDVVYLYQFPRSPVAPNLSPYCLKLETFLRVHGIKYEVIGNMFHRSEKGRLPFVELNGQQMADSQVIIWNLQKHFKIDEEFLSKEQKGVARAVERMIEGSTFYPLQWDKGVVNARNLLSRNISGAPLPAFVTNILAKRFGDAIRKRINSALAGLSKEERETLLRKDIEALDAILGDKKFLFGDRITVADCCVFGQLAVTGFLPFRQTITDLLEDDFPRVRQYLERIRSHYYPEWKE